MLPGERGREWKRRERGGRREGERGRGREGERERGKEEKEKGRNVMRKTIGGIE